MAVVITPVLSLVLMICAQAEAFSDNDHVDGTFGYPEYVSWIPETSMETTNKSWFRMDDFGDDQERSSSLYSGDAISSSFPGETEEKNASSEPVEWNWQPIQWDWWVILQMVAALLGIIGNLLVIILLFQRREKSKSTDRLVGALAMADLSSSVFMIPLPFADRVPLTILGQIYCRIIYNALFRWISIDASIMTLTFIPVERYIAIAHPLRCKDYISHKKIRAVVGITWFIGFMMNIIFAWVTTLDASSYKCSVVYPWKPMQKGIGVFTFTLEFCIPCLITFSMQVLTARSLHHQSRLHLGADKRLDRSNPSTRHLLAKRRVLEMLFIVVLVFIISWGPNSFLFLAYNFSLIPGTYLYSPLYRAVNVLSFCNSCANPIIYTVRYPEFRKALKDIFLPSKRNKAPLFDDRVSRF